MSFWMNKRGEKGEGYNKEMPLWSGGFSWMNVRWHWSVKKTIQWLGMAKAK